MASKPIKLLFLANGISLAHPTRMWKLACELDDLGYSVEFATSKNYWNFLLPQKGNIPIHHISAISSTEFNRRLHQTQFLFTPEEMEIDLQEDTTLISETRPDFIIADSRPTALIPARLNGIPYINLSQYHWLHGLENRRILPPVKAVHQFGRSISTFMSPLVAPLIENSMLKIANGFFQSHPLAKQACIERFNTLSDFYLAGDQVLYADLKELYPNASPPQHHHFIGPVIWHNLETPWPEHWPEDFGKKPLAYVSMGSTGLHSTIPDILDGLRDAGFQIILSGFGYEGTNLDLRDTYTTAQFVPGEAAIRKADLVVCNGGTGTTYHAMSHKRPIIAIVQNMDQALHSFQLDKIGAARMIYADLVTPEKISSTATDLMESQQTKAILDQIGTQISALDQKKILADIIQTCGSRENKIMRFQKI